MPAIDLAPRIELLRALADHADAIALTYFQRTDLEIQSKPDASPVTEADLAIETALRTMIRRAFPEDALLGEEHGEEHGKEHDAEHAARGAEHAPRGAEHAPAPRYRWVLDPIDGTVSFANGVPLFGTLIGLECANEVVAGVCSMPALGERVWAARGHGAHWERVNLAASRTSSDASPTRISTPARVRHCAELSQALVCTTGLEYFERNGTTDALVRVARAAGRIRGFSDCYGAMLVATGRADAWFDPVMHPWDSGPFPVIFAEAGGVFTDWRGRCDIHGGSAVAACPSLHEELLELIRPGEGSSEPVLGH